VIHLVVSNKIEMNTPHSLGEKWSGNSRIQGEQRVKLTSWKPILKKGPTGDQEESKTPNQKVLT
jgi:hypothetical protein